MAELSTPPGDLTGPHLWAQLHSSSLVLLEEEKEKEVIHFLHV